MIGIMIAMKNYHSFGGYLLILISVIAIIEPTYQQSNFDYNYMNSDGRVNAESIDDNGNIIDTDNDDTDNDKRNIASLQYYEDFDKINDKVVFCFLISN